MLAGSCCSSDAGAQLLRQQLKSSWAGKGHDPPEVWIVRTRTTVVATMILAKYSMTVEVRVGIQYSKVEDLKFMLRLIISSFLA